MGMTGLRVLAVAPRVRDWQRLQDALADEGLEIVRASSPSAVTERSLERVAPDVALVDVTLPGPAVVTLASALVGRSPAVPVVALCDTVDDARLSFAISAGARACLPGSVTPSVLADAVREAAAGGFPLARDLAGRTELVVNLVSELQRRLRVEDGPDPTPSAGPCPLTERELVILQMVADGHANKEAAVTLDITERTVKNHLANIFDKLTARGRAHAVRLAMENRWICTGEPHSMSDRAVRSGIAA